MCIFCKKRTAKEIRKIRKSISLLLVWGVLSLLIQVPCITVWAEETGKDDLQLYAHSAVLMDADTGRVLYGKNATEILPMASTTKIMTCILALEYGNLLEEAEVSAYAASMPKVKLSVKQGEKYRLEDLLYSLMLESHNDSAVVIAETVGCSVEGFAVMMNQKARDIGCCDTYFITPNGLDAVITDNGQKHSTTAADLAKIMAYCVKESPAKDKFIQITQTREYDFSDVGGNRNFHCTNHNSFLDMMEEAVSGKTGFTNQAGYCYVGAVESEGRTFTVALLACGWPNHKTYKWSDMKKLVAYGMEKYSYCDIYEKQQFDNIPVKEGIAGKKATPYDIAYTGAVLEQQTEETLPYLLCEEDKIEVQTNVIQELTAPVQAGEKVGEVNYYLNGNLIESYTVVTANAVDRVNFVWFMQYILTLYLSYLTG